MNKAKVEEKAAPGAESPVESKDLNVATVEKWLKNDLAKCISCLNAIYSDPDLLRSVATFMLGRMNNAKAHEVVDKNQTKLDV